MSQTGALLRLREKWKSKSARVLCDSKAGSLKPVSLNKIILLFGLLFFGIIFAVIVMVIEKNLPQSYKQNEKLSCNEDENK